MTENKVCKTFPKTHCSPHQPGQTLWAKPHCTKAQMDQKCLSVFQLPTDGGTVHRYSLMTETQHEQLQAAKWLLVEVGTPRRYEGETDAVCLVKVFVKQII